MRTQANGLAQAYEYVIPSEAQVVQREDDREQACEAFKVVNVDTNMRE
jgi:hypothetical protein